MRGPVSGWGFVSALRHCRQAVRPERSNERMNVGLRVVGRQHNKFGIRSPRFLRQLASVPLVGLAVETQNCEICDACQRSRGDVRWAVI